MTIVKHLRSYIQEKLQASSGEAHVTVQFLDEQKMGDYATNIALIKGKKIGKAPMHIAEDIVKQFNASSKGFAVADVAPPGFINITVDDAVLAQYISSVTREREKKGKASVEFISANPTGPLHMGNARGGPIGDVIANLLTISGYEVMREYLHNDAGAQVEKFQDALWYWYQKTLGVESDMSPEYQGVYMRELGEAAQIQYADTLLTDPEGKQQLTMFAFNELMKENFAVLKAMGIHFDRVTKESDLLHETPHVISDLKKQGLLKMHDGALWFLPKEKEELTAVVMKGDGTYLYFANDITYHKKKFSENDVVVDILGEGHQGHIPKLRAVADVYGYPQERFYIVVHGMVHIKKEGTRVSMSKRAGNFVTAKEVLDEVGRDAFRFFLLQYSPRTAMQFDIDLAREQSKKNPVYYVQYAYARSANILQKSGIQHPQRPSVIPKLLYEEHRVLRRIATFPEVVEDTISDFEVQRLTRFAYELARDFTQFYEKHRVIGADTMEEEQRRLWITAEVKRCLRESLDLLGLRAPESM